MKPWKGHSYTGVSASCVQPPVPLLEIVEGEKELTFTGLTGFDLRVTVFGIHRDSNGSFKHVGQIAVAFILECTETVTVNVFQDCRSNYLVIAEIPDRADIDGMKDCYDVAA